MSFPRYERYRDSGAEWLGEVPEHWEVFALKRIANLQSGDSIAPEVIEPIGEYPVYGGNGLRGFTSTFTHQGNYALIGRQGALCGNINYASGKFWASEHAIVVTPTCDADITWLGELLREMNLNQYSIASAQPGLSVDNIRKLLIAVPTLSEQKAIGYFLRQETAKIDELIEEQRLIELLKEKRQAVISRAVALIPSPQLGEPDAPTAISLNRLRHHVVRIDQGWSPVAADRDPEPGEWAVLKLSAVKRGEFDETKIKALPPEAEILDRLQLKDGDFLITRANTPDLVGDSCYVSNPPPRLIYTVLDSRISCSLQRF
jgi:type I restriction enzyme, S subunit